jgi:hypothetical protein
MVSTTLSGVTFRVLPTCRQHCLLYSAPGSSDEANEQFQSSYPHTGKHSRDFICVPRYPGPSALLHLQMGQVGLGKLEFLRDSLRDCDKAKEASKSFLSMMLGIGLKVSGDRPKYAIVFIRSRTFLTSIFVSHDRVAQWQSIGLRNQRLRVRNPSRLGKCFIPSLKGFPLMISHGTSTSAKTCL